MCSSDLDQRTGCLCRKNIGSVFHVGEKILHFLIYIIDGSFAVQEYLCCLIPKCKRRIFPAPVFKGVDMAPVRKRVKSAVKSAYMKPNPSAPS